MTQPAPTVPVRGSIGHTNRYSTLRFRTRCGVVGGVGPEATAEFYRLLVQSRARIYHDLKACVVAGLSPQTTLARVRERSSAPWTIEQLELLRTYPRDIRGTQLSDQHHFPVIIHANPQIPDRSSYILDPEGASNPEPFLVDTVESLLRAGANLIVMPCNTAHNFLPAIRAQFAELPVEFLDMPRIAARVALRHGDRVGVLATSGTLASGLYEQALQNSATQGRHTLVLPDDQSRLMHAIFGESGIKAGFADTTTDAGRSNLDALTDVVTDLWSRGAQAIVAGCTELPLLLSSERLRERGLPAIPVVDPSACLADEVVRRTLLSRY